MQATATSASEHPTWEIQHEIPRRLRLRCLGLQDSELLRRHCRIVLNGCHWLEGFRINPIAGCLTVHFPAHQRAEIQLVLDLALNLPAGYNTLLELNQGNVRGSKNICHGAVCLGLLALDWLVGLPLLALQGAAALMMLPMVVELIHTVQKERRLPVETLDLGFGAVLLQQGLPLEVLTDLALDDGSSLLRDRGQHESGHADYRDLITQLGEQERVLSSKPDEIERPIAQLREGDGIHLKGGDLVFMPCQVAKGTLLVINRQINGDWHPHQVMPGDVLEPGSLVLSGSAELEILQSFNDCPLFQLPPARIQQAEGRPWQAGQRILNPLLFGLGSFWALAGASERALATFQFNPINDWETSRNANRLAAAAELGLQGISITNLDVFSTLGRMQRLIVSPSCAKRLQRHELQEELEIGSGLRQGELVRILAGLQQCLIKEQSLPLWNTQLENVSDPIAVSRVELNDLSQQGWLLELEDGRKLTIVNGMKPATTKSDTGRTMAPLEFREGQLRLGWVSLQSRQSKGWDQARLQLEHLGVAVEVINESDHVINDSRQRLQQVEMYQAKGEQVGYLGDVIHDIPALARADVAIGLNFDEAGMFTHRLCDLSLSSDPQWLPRLVALSRSIEHTAASNAVMIGVTHIISSVATAGLSISPLQTVLLADIPLILAELRSIKSFRSHTGSAVS